MIDEEVQRLMKVCGMHVKATEDEDSFPPSVSSSENLMSEAGPMSSWRC